jgi:hypothetical protein
MPKELIDYTETIIYKIYCKNPDVKYFYVGHTTNFVQRKYFHKTHCKSSQNNSELYNMVRENGGWNNWHMIEIARYKCKDHNEAKMREEECRNSCIAELKDNKDNKKSSKKFHCITCDYITSRESQFIRHLSTDKHRRITEDNKKVPQQTQNFVCQNSSEEHVFSCVCGNTYLHKSGLSKHKKKCPKLLTTFVSLKNNQTNEELFMSILKDNQEFKQLLIEQNATIMELATKNTTVINNTNSNHFNLQMFLNVHCKDALNINEFVDSLKPTIEDLETTGRLGYVEGISNIFLNGLKGLDINRRPLHCSDQKRATIYIKNNDIWEKENDSRDLLKQAIRDVASKNMKQIFVWQKENPDCFSSSSKKNDQYLRIVSNSMNGLTVEETQQNYDKIITKIAKEVTINKDNYHS